jgi:tetratricopeptide (TPR) repeat protein
MALRLTGTSAVSQPAFSPAALATQADGLLASGNLAPYAALFDRATSHPEAAERHHARLALVESGLCAAATGTPALATQIYLALAHAVVAILGEEAREPLLLNYAGIAFYELWSLDAARAMFKAAARLDPQLPNLRGNLAETEKRRRGGQRPGGAHRPLHTSLPALARRAQRLADAAMPAKGLTLSLCMIVRDEEEMLGRCLAAAAPAVDEIVIVDTGSTDATVQIARSHCARVIEREWTGSFADARNVACEAATGDWIIYLDADEVLVADDIAVLRGLTSQVWREAFYLLETSYTGEEDDGTGVVHNTLRVFRNRDEHRFEGRLHEQITGLPHDVPGRIEQTTVRIQHYGYLGSVRDAKAKSQRNIELLRAQSLDSAPSAFLHFNLGMEYAAIGDPANAVSELERAWALVRAQGLERRDYVPALLVRLANSLVRAGRPEDAIALADETLALFPGFTDLVFAQAWALVALQRGDEAVAAWQRCLDMGDAPARYCASVGAGTFLPLLALANHHFAAGELAAAGDLLARSLQEYPNFAAAAGRYVSVLIAAGMAPADAISELERRLDGPVASTARFLVAQAVHSAGALDCAEAQYRLVLEARPHTAQVQVTLAELLLCLGRHAEAAQLAHAVKDTDPYATLAVRIELWATIAAGSLDAVAALHARAHALGVPSSQLEVFEQWAALAAGQAPVRGLHVAATPLLGVILEQLLTRQDFTGFESLLPLLHNSELPAREQREILGCMYLRFGFLQSAAREWMAVCEVEPDARALVGLARVAAAHGLGDDAVTFAAQAVALDPAAEESQALLATLMQAAEQGAELPMS